MTPELITKVGECLYGKRWKQPLSDDVGREVRTVKYWINRGCPDSYREQLALLLMKRKTEIDKALKTLLKP